MWGEYRTLSTEDFNHAYSAYVDELLNELTKIEYYDSQGTYTPRFYGLQFNKSRKYRIPPEILEFMSTKVIVKPHSYSLKVGIRVPIYIDPRTLMQFGNLCRGSTISNMNFPDWVLFIIDSNPHANTDGVYYVNCNPDSKSYGHVLVIRTDIYHMPVLRIQYLNVVSIVEKLESWLALCPIGAQYEPLYTDSVDIATEFLKIPYFDAEFVSKDCEFPVRSNPRNILCSAMDFGVELSEYRKQLVKEVENYIVKFLMQPQYQPKSDENIGWYSISFTNFLFRDHA